MNPQSTVSAFIQAQIAEATRRQMQQYYDLEYRRLLEARLDAHWERWDSPDPLVNDL